MEEAKQIAKQINTGDFKPLYLLHGEEPYYIDAISDLIQAKALPEESKAFNEIIVYGKDAQLDEIVSQAKRYPMMSERQLIVIKEAQHLSRQLDQLASYAANPMQSTILVLCYKYNKPDKRKAFYKSCLKNGVVLESKKLYDNKIPQWISQHLSQRGFSIHPQASHLLFECLGSDLSKIAKEVEKLEIVLPKGTKITADHIEAHIGVSKDYNNFELKKALAEYQLEKAYKIIQYFSQNPKDHPFIVTVSILHSFFTQVMQYHGLRDHNPKQLAASLGVSPFFIGEIKQAAQRYPMKRVSQVLHTLKDLDLKNKGVGAPSDQANLLKELLIKVL